jgi:hypothetical protein
MPNDRKTLTAPELKRKITRQRKRRGELEERLQRLGAWLRRAARRLQKKRRRERRQARKIGPFAAVKWGLAQLGVAEKPDGSNWGVPVETWIKFTGYGGPVPWCGCYVAWAVVKVGQAAIPARIRLGYHGYIIADANAGANGLRAVPIAQAKPGDIVAFNFAHIALVREPYDGSGYLETVEGNTSPTTAGSQNNGGTVAAKRRPIGDVAVIARPNYDD